FFSTSRFLVAHLKTTLIAITRALAAWGVAIFLSLRTSIASAPILASGKSLKSLSEFGEIFSSNVDSRIHLRSRCVLGLRCLKSTDSKYLTHSHRQVLGVMPFGALIGVAFFAASYCAMNSGVQGTPRRRTLGRPLTR